MDIIVALDIKNNGIVHGIKGMRDKYVAPKSYLFNEPFYKNVVSSIITKLHITKFYIADLNAITGNEDNSLIIKKIISEFPDIEVYLDAGISCKEKVQDYLELGVAKVIIGSETLNSINDLKEIVDKYTNERIMFSIDSIDGKVISKDISLKGKE